MTSAYCAAGEEFVANNMCEPCQRGFYKANVTRVARFDKCTVCPVNLITATTGATSQDNCNQGKLLSLGGILWHYANATKGFH